MIDFHREELSSAPKTDFACRFRDALLQPSVPPVKKGVKGNNNNKNQNKQDRQPCLQLHVLAGIVISSKEPGNQVDEVSQRGCMQRATTLETLFHRLCSDGDGIRLQFLEGNPGGLRLTLRQIKAATRAAMTGLEQDYFVMTFKRGDRFIIPCKQGK